LVLTQGGNQGKEKRKHQSRHQGERESPDLRTEKENPRSCHEGKGYRFWPSMIRKDSNRPSDKSRSLRGKGRESDRRGKWETSLLLKLKGKRVPRLPRKKRVTGLAAQSEKKKEKDREW